MKLKKGTILQGGKYTIEQTLGQGSFGITYLATAKFSTSGNLGKMDVMAKVAIKEFFMSDINGRKEDGSTVEGSSGSIFTNYKNRFRKEAVNLATLSHPNIVKVFDVFDENNTTYYVMEYLSDTSLNKYIKDKKGLSEDECIEMTQGIGDALQYMHNSMMMHLDLKPGNIMIRNGKPVLIDFGLSKQFNTIGQPETSTTIGQGTPGYAPLEQQNYNGKQSNGLPYAMDVYALGGTMFKMLTGQTPPDASSIFNDGFPRDELLAHKVSNQLIDAVKRAMAPSKKERYQTVSELLSAVNPDKDLTAYKSDEQITVTETVTDVKLESKAKATKSNSGKRTFWVAVHILIVGIMIFLFLNEPSYEENRGVYQSYNTFYEAIMFESHYYHNWAIPYIAITFLIIGLYLLLKITWNKKPRTLYSFGGVLMIVISSHTVSVGCYNTYENMMWIGFLALSLLSSYCISVCTSKESK